MIGEILNEQYRILSILGTGRCGQTYLAEDKKANVEPRCVIKQFEPEAKDTLSLRKAKYLFAREVKILKILGKSDRIPSLLAFFRAKERFYLVHEFIDGTDLAAEFESHQQWTPTQVVSLLREILEIVEVAHREKVIHQDIKPTNIIRRKSDGKLILIDFGSVKKINNQIANADGKTELTVPIGTRGYMSPEQKSIRPKLASDVYAIGMIGIYALTGVEPEDIPVEHQTETVQWRDLVQIDDKLAMILERMVSPNLKKRYSSASEALQAIRNLKLGNNNNLFSIKTIVSVGILFLAIFGAGYYYWQLENSLSRTPKKDYFENDREEFPFLYRNSDYGVEIKYPSSWRLTEPKQNQKMIAKFTPQKNQSYVVVPQANIQVEKSASSSLEQQTTSAVYQITTLPNTKIIDSRPTELDNKQAHKVVYTQINPENNLETKHLQIWTLDNGFVYTVSYQAAAAEYANFVKTVENEVFKSLKINSNP